MSRSIRNIQISLVSALLCILFLAGCTTSTSKNVEVSFAKGQWSRNDWILVKSPRWDYIGKWLQEDDHILNACPPDATPNDMLEKRASETYASMLWNDTISGDFTVSSTMSFDYRMAPLITISGPIGANASGYPEYREHWEIVIFDKGINIWHHAYVDGAPVIKKIATSVKNYRDPSVFQPGQKYDLQVKVQRENGTAVATVTCGDITVETTIENLPEDLRVGITGCEGVNRFYDFKIQK